MRRAAVLSVLASVLALTTACGSSDPVDTSQTKVIPITISGDTVTPNGDTIKVGINQPIELDVTSDAPGELHVHSGGDGQEFEYQAGSNTFTFKVATAGVVPVETHTLNKTIVQLQVQ